MVRGWGKCKNKKEGDGKGGWFEMFSVLFIDLQRPTVREDAKE